MATLLRHRMQNNWTLFEWLTMAATSLNTRSTCKLIVKDHTATQLTILFHLSHCPVLLSTMHYKSNHWSAESGQWQNKHISCHNFRMMRQYFFTLKSYPCTLWSVAPCLWMKFTYFSKQRQVTWNQIQNPNETVSGRRIGLHIGLTRNHVAYLAKLLSDICQSIGREHDPRNRIWMNQYA